MLERKNLIKRGKAKTLYQTNDPNRLIMVFRDDVSAFNGEKKATLANKGRINNQISFFIMQVLSQAGIETQVEEIYSAHEVVVKKLSMLPLEAIIRNKAAGSVCKRFSLSQGYPFKPPLFEIFLKNDLLGDPLIRDEHILAFNWATTDQLTQIKSISFKVNEILVPLFERVNLELIDFKIEFGLYQERIVIGDEFSPDGCRLRDKHSGRILDKDRFRQGLSELVESYQEIAKRLNIPEIKMTTSFSTK